jgi:hypothetical protein
MSTARTERLAKIDRLIDFLARQRGEFPEPRPNWGSLLDFADLTEEEIDQARIALNAISPANVPAGEV